MSQSEIDLSGDTARPFHLERVARPQWLQGAAFGCGALALLMLLSGIVLAHRFGSLLASYFESLEATVTASLAADMTQEQTDRLARAFDGARARVLSDAYLDPEALEAISQSALRLGVSPADQTMSELVEALELLASGGETEAEVEETPAAVYR